MAGLYTMKNRQAMADFQCPAMVQQRLGPMGLAGFFCNGEIGPVGERSFLHGYTASLALFVKKAG
jgi:small ligand-binding sensory domain FIST